MGRLGAARTLGAILGPAMCGLFAIIGLLAPLYLAAGITLFTIGLAKEVATEGIRVNAVRPGVILTDIHDTSGEIGRVERVAPLVPMQRAGTATEVAEAIMWLISEKSTYTTGAIIDVTGGR